MKNCCAAVIAVFVLPVVLSMTALFSPLLSAQDTTIIQPVMRPPATLQIIHASADPTFSPASFWVGRSSSFEPLLSNKGLGSASFVQTSLGTMIATLDSAINSPLMLNVTVPTNTAATPELASFPFTLGRGSNTIVAVGMLRPRYFSSNPNQKNTAFELLHIVDTVTTTTSGNVRLLLVHAASDAQRIDVVVRQTGMILATLEYTQSSFATVPVGDYIIDVRYSTSQSVIASFDAPLQTSNFGGQHPVTFVLTGFLDPSKNQDGQPLGIVAVSSTPIVLDSATTTSSTILANVDKPFTALNSTTTIQVIDNAADVSRLPLVTILNARPANSTTPTVSPIGQPLRFRGASIRLGTTAVTTVSIVDMMRVLTQSVLTLDNVIGSQILALAERVRPLPGRPIADIATSLPQTTLMRGANTIVATGVIDTNDYAKNPDGISIRTKFTSFVDSSDSVAAGNVRVLLANGVTDSKQLIVRIRGGDSLGSFKYSEGQFLTLPAQQFTLDFTTYGTDDVIGSFIVPLQDYAGQRVSVMTSGFMNALNNSNGQPLALMLVPEQPSTTNRISLLQPAPVTAGVAETTLQVIQASADAGLSPVGVGVRFPISSTNGVFLPVSPSLQFRQADTAVTGLGRFAPFLKDITGINLTAYLTRERAVSAVSSLYEQNLNLARGVNVVIASGMLNPRLHTQNPDSLSTGVGLYQFVDRTRTIAPDSVRVLVFHSVTDAPRIDILSRANSGGNVGGTSATLATLRYTEGTWLTLPLADYTLDIAPAGKMDVLASFSAPLQSLGMGGKRITISATGILNPSQNQWLQPIGLYAVSNGSSADIISTTTTTLSTTIAALPNPAVITATGTTLTTTSYVVSTTANGETTTSITIASNIFTPDSVSIGAKPPIGSVFPTKPTAIMTTTTTVTSTLTSAIRMYVTTSSVTLLNGSSTTTTTASTIYYATTSSLSLSMLLPTVPLPLTTTTTTTFGRADIEESITSAAVYPNPATDHTTLSYTLKREEAVSVSLFDTSGQLLYTLETTNTKAAGTYSLDFGTQTLQSGVYEARIVSQSGSKTVKVVIVK